MVVPNKKAVKYWTTILLLASSALVTSFVTTTKRVVPLPRSEHLVKIRRTNAASFSVRTSSTIILANANGPTTGDTDDSSGGRFSPKSNTRSKTRTRTTGLRMATNQTSAQLLVPPPRTTLAYQTPINGDAAVALPPPAVSSKLPFALVLWKFTRPHTLIGSALAIPALTILAAPTYGALLSSSVANAVLYAMVPSLLMNLYITGLNQVTDVEIDAVNKPYLPIPAGLLRRDHAAMVCAVSLVASLALGVAHPVYGTVGLNVALWGSAILGTLYSLEPFRLKRFPLLAAFCIVAVRGTIINAGFYAHAKAAAFGVGAASSGVLSILTNDWRCGLSCSYFAVFGLVIALMKDVPDVLGDRLASIRTFSVRVGPQRIFHFSRRMLGLLLYSTAAGFGKLAYNAVAATSSSPGLVIGRLVVAACSVIAGVSVGTKASGVDPENPEDVYSYYMHLWKIFYASYLLLPLAR